MVFEKPAASAVHEGHRYGRCKPPSVEGPSHTHGLSTEAVG